MFWVHLFVSVLGWQTSWTGPGGGELLRAGGPTGGANAGDGGDAVEMGMGLLYIITAKTTEIHIYIYIKIDT